MDLVAQMRELGFWPADNKAGQAAAVELSRTINDQAAGRHSVVDCGGNNEK
jgi:hypothetical protein